MGHLVLENYEYETKMAGEKNPSNKLLRAEEMKKLNWNYSDWIIENRDVFKVPKD